MPKLLWRTRTRRREGEEEEEEEEEDMYIYIYSQYLFFFNVNAQEIEDKTDADVRERADQQEPRRGQDGCPRATAGRSQPSPLEMEEEVV